MPLSATDIVQSNSDAGTAASLPAGTTAGNTVVVVVGCSATISSTSMTGFTRGTPTPSGNARAMVFRKAAVDAETSWTITNVGTGLTCWRAYELQGVDLDAPVDAVPANHALGSGTSISTSESGGNPQTTSYDVLILAAHVAYTPTGGVAAGISGHDQGMVEDAEVQTNDGTKALVLSVSLKFTQSLTVPDVTATRSDAAQTSGIAATHVAYTAAGAKKAPHLGWMMGAEWGTAAGLATGNAGARIFETISGTPTITTSTPRSGSYCLELPATATTDFVTAVAQAVSTAGAGGTPERVCFRFVGSVPPSDVELYSQVITGGNAVVRFVAASGKLGLKIGTGTEQLSDATVAADQWIAVDLRVYDAGAEWFGDWAVTYDATPGASTEPVAQTRATLTTATGIGSYTPLLGRQVAPSSAPPLIRYDDVVCSSVRGHYPLGDHRVLPIGVDPAGTLTVSGSTANFNTFTANGTMAAWNATTARGAIDEVPPTIGASADGIAQVAAAATEYVEIPLTTVQGAPDGAVRAVRLYFCGWAASATAATVGFRDHDGVAEHILFAATDPAFDSSTSDPAWVCRMAGVAAGSVARPEWTQPKVDSLVARVGFSDDATPDIGIHAVIGEAAKQMADVGSIIGAAGSVEVTEARDPFSGGMISTTVDTPAGQGTTLFWDDAGTPGSQVVAPSSSHTETFDGVDASIVVEVGVISGNEAPDRP